MSKPVAPIYAFSDLCTMPPYPEKPGGYHYVIQSVVDGPMRTWPIVEDLGIGYRELEDGTTVWSEKTILEARDMASKARARTAELNQESFNTHIKGRAFSRYVIGHTYVTVQASEVERLASIFKTLPEQIKITHNLQILHVADFVLWGDGRITKAPLGELPPGGILSQDAIGLISSVRGADGGTVHLPGGLASLANIKHIHGEQEIDSGPSRGHYAAEKIIEYDVEWVSGLRTKIYAHTAGYFEGYMFDIYAERPALGGTPGPDGITTFPPDDFEYDPDLGYVSQD